MSGNLDIRYSAVRQQITVASNKVVYESVPVS